MPQRSADGKVRAVDMYLFSAADFSRPRSADACCRSSPMSRGASSTNSSRANATMSTTFRSCEDESLINQGKIQEALAIVKDLKPETRRESRPLESSAGGTEI